MIPRCCRLDEIAREIKWFEGAPGPPEATALPTGSLFPDKSGGIVRPLPRPVRGERLIPIARGRLVPRTLAGPGLNLAPRQIGPQRRR
jgi:hypothetical protein